jgi:uncharacterized membrane protein YkvA (DUF1232 family)
MRKAERLLRNTHQTIEIVSRGAQKADRHQNALTAVRHELRSLFRMVKGWASGRYRQVPWKTVVLSTGAILYFLDPIDIVPDVIPMLGFIDDIAVLRWVIGGIQADLSKFRDWEESRVEVEAGNLVP